MGQAATIRDGTRNKFWGGLQFFTAYTYKLYEFAKRIKQYSSLRVELRKNLLKENQNKRGSNTIYEKEQK